MHQARGYELFFNRDERKSRAPENAPSMQLLDGTRVLLPGDSEHGGTWISTNEHGVSLCLLNGYRERELSERASARSRGLLVRQLASASSLDALRSAVERLDLARYQSFVLVMFASAEPTCSLEWDGTECRWSANVEQRMPICSCGHDQAAAQSERRAALEQLLQAGGLRRETLERFHRAHASEPYVHAACTHRVESETRSFSHVIVTPAASHMRYAPGPPCRTAVSVELSLTPATKPRT
jgi:hypothetical protein